jgi:hypothetical protein
MIGTATTCTPSPNHFRMMLQATDNLPMNFAFTGKGNSSKPEGAPTSSSSPFTSYFRPISVILIIDR